MGNVENSEHSKPVSVECGVRGRWQYYYKQNQCTAQTAESADCICWHDEGSGPNRDAVHDRPYEDRWLTWRLAPNDQS